MIDLKFFYITHLNQALFLFFFSIFALSYCYNLVRYLRISPPKLIQAGFHLFGYFFALILALSFLLLIFFLSLLLLKTLVMAPPLFHLLADLLIIFSELEVAIKYPFFLVHKLVSLFISSILSIGYTNALPFAL